MTEKRKYEKSLDTLIETCLDAEEEIENMQKGLDTLKTGFKNHRTFFEKTKRELAVLTV